MQAALAEALPGAIPMPADMIAGNEDDQPENQVDDDDLATEVILGFDRLRRMSHTELRDVIDSRVTLLETELREREARREAIRTARTASQLLDLRRERSRRIYRNVNLGSAVAAVAGTFFIAFAMV